MVANTINLLWENIYTSKGQIFWQASNQRGRGGGGALVEEEKDNLRARVYPKWPT